MTRATPGPRLTRIWLFLLAVPATFQIVLSVLAGERGSFVSPLVLFWGVIVAAGLCAVTSLAMITRAWCTGEAELGFTGTFFLAMSVLPLAHGVTTPGVIFDDNSATLVASLIGIPVGLLATAPMLSHGFRRTVVAGERWRVWVVATSAIAVSLSVALVMSPDALPTPTPSSVAVRAIAVVSFIGCVALSFRHLRLARIAQHAGPLAVAAGYALVGSTAFVWLGAAPYSAGFWAAHLIDMVGVFLATVAGLVVYQRTDSVRDVMGSVLAVDPLGALEVGLDPIVHRFVADLDTKDRITRDHVVRTARLAVQLGDEFGLDAAELRTLGLAGILHDVGKLAIPDEILQKPGRLTAEEYEAIKTHTVEGERLVATSPVLAGIASIVRGHHERIDGGGYPDGLTGDLIPLSARIVAVCDAYDAMANTRLYREGMGSDRAIAILREHAGSQWDEAAVEALARVVDHVPPATVRAFEDVGRIGCDCLPAVDELAEIVSDADDLVGADG